MPLSIPRRRFATLSSLFLLAGIAAFPSTAAAQADHYRLRRLPSLGGVNSTALALNEQGQVVGSSETADGIRHPTLWSRDGVVDLTPGGPAGEALGINKAGTVVGQSPMGTTATWTNGSYQTLGEGYIHGINRRGIRVGRYHDNAWMWRLNTDHALSGLHYSIVDEAMAVNDAGVAVGGSDVATTRGSAERPVYWTNQGVFELPTPLYTGEAVAINSLGQIAGWSSIPGVPSSLALRWDGGQYTILPGLSYNDTAATGINDAGLVVGWSINDPGLSRAVLWNGTAITDLNDRLDQAWKDRGWILTRANAINPKGWIAGQMWNYQTGEYAAYVMVPQ